MKRDRLLHPLAVFKSVNKLHPAPIVIHGRNFHVNQAVLVADPADDLVREIRSERRRLLGPTDPKHAVFSKRPFEPGEFPLQVSFVFSEKMNEVGFGTEDLIGSEKWVKSD